MDSSRRQSKYNNYNIPDPPCYVLPRKYTSYQAKPEEPNPFEVTTVPAFFSSQHPSTKQLIRIFVAKDCKRIQRMVQKNNRIFRGNYFQISDDPSLYAGKDQRCNRPAFQPSGQTVLYLTPVGLCIFLRAEKVLRFLISLYAVHGPLVDFNEWCYVNYVYHAGSPSDIFKINLFALAVHCEAYSLIPCMMKHSLWCTHDQKKSLYRKQYCAIMYHFFDAIDFVLFKMIYYRPTIQLQTIIRILIDDPEHFKITEMEQRPKMLYDKLLRRIVDDKGSILCSIPQRILQFAYFHDQDCLLQMQLLNCIELYEKALFFHKRAANEEFVNITTRIALVSEFETGNKRSCDKRYFLVDIDCCIGLLFCLLCRAHNNSPSLYMKGVKLVVKIFFATGWSQPVYELEDKQELIEYLRRLPIIKGQMARRDIEAVCTGLVDVFNNDECVRNDLDRHTYAYFDKFRPATRKYAGGFYGVVNHSPTQI